MPSDDDEGRRWTEIGKRLGAARNRLNLSKRAAAARAGFSEGTWRQLEAGERQVAPGMTLPVSPSDRTLTAAARAVELDPAEVFALAGRTYNHAAHTEDVESVKIDIDARFDELHRRLDALGESMNRIAQTLELLMEDAEASRRARTPARRGG